MARKLSSANLILAALRENRSGVTAKRAARLFDITEDGFRARVTELRKAGFSIYTNRKPTGTTYRLGQTHRREVVAGRILLADPGLANAFADQIERNFSLV